MSWTSNSTSSYECSRYTDLIGKFRWVCRYLTHQVWFTAYVATGLLAVSFVVYTLMQQCCCMKDFTHSMKLKVIIYVFVGAACTVRATLWSLPEDVWYVLQQHSFLQIFLDLLPEVLFLSVDMRLLALWFELHCVAAAAPQARQTLFSRIGLAGLLFVYASALIFAAAFSTKQYGTYTQKAEAIFVGCLAFLYGLSFLIIGQRVVRTLRLHLGQTNKTRVLKKLYALLIGVCIALMLHIAYGLVVSYTGQQICTLSHAWLWLFYFLITELLPNIFILMLTSPIHCGGPRYRPLTVQE